MAKIVLFRAKYCKLTPIIDDVDFEDQQNPSPGAAQREMGVGGSPLDTPEKKPKLPPVTDAAASKPSPAPVPEPKKIIEEAQNKSPPAAEEPGASSPLPAVEETATGAAGGASTGDDKASLIEKMKQQNAKLKKEFAALKDKLEECIEKAKRGGKGAGEKSAPNEEDMSMVCDF